MDENKLGADSVSVFDDKRIYGPEIRFPEPDSTGRQRVEFVCLSEFRMRGLEYNQDTPDIECDAQEVGTTDAGKKFKTASIPLKEQLRNFMRVKKWKSFKGHAIAVTRTGKSRNTKYYIDELSEQYVKSKMGAK